MTTLERPVRIDEETLLTAHLLRRAGFGVTPRELDKYCTMAYSDIVEALLHPGPSSTTMPTDVIFRFFPEYHGASGPDAYVFWGYKMITTDNPLEEKMTLFWHGIFATGNDKLNSPQPILNQIDMFRRFGTGKFDDILLELSKDPAMLIWLDNQTNHNGSINENYGREILELFSLGVGNYTEDDIKECARAFTGWSVKNAEYMALRSQKDSIWPYSRISWHFEYQEDDHDAGEKTFLGETGNFDGDDIIEIICRQDAAANFISRHLYNFFVEDEFSVPSWSDTPPKDPEAISLLAQTYVESDHSILAMLRVLFNSDFFKQAAYKKVKGPVELVAGTLRLTGEMDSLKPGLISILTEAGFMGQLLFYPPSVEGWHTGQEWVNSGTLMERVNFAASHIGNLNHPGIRDLVDRIVDSCGTRPDPEALVDKVLELLGPVYASSETRASLINLASSNGTIDASDYPNNLEFDNLASDVLRMVTATREYQMV
ncbi:DUF1800 domain-containing protein [Dehalococcoidia bacterium]|nr:DUF1800 domain-containing protein [Dehalococcoidia bacterium]